MYKRQKLRSDDLTPVSWPADPTLEWCPPGHGDIYVSLVTSGVLDALLAKGIRFAFLSNSDNLGATCDPDVAAWMVEHDDELRPVAGDVREAPEADRLEALRLTRLAVKSRRPEVSATTEIYTLHIVGSVRCV